MLDQRIHSLRVCGQRHFVQATCMISKPHSETMCSHTKQSLRLEPGANFHLKMWMCSTPAPCTCPSRVFMSCNVWTHLLFPV